MSRSGIGARAERYSGKRVWKLVVKGRPVGHAPAPDGEADRPLGGDVDGLGPGGRGSRADRLRAGAGEPDLGIGRERPGAEVGRGEHRHLDPELRQLLAGPFERADDAVDLRPPGVGRDEQPHAEALASTG